MPKEPNKLLRIVVPLAVIVAGIGIAIAVVRNTSKGAGQSPTTAKQTASASPAGTPLVSPTTPPATPTSSTTQTAAAQSPAPTETPPPAAGSPPSMQAAPPAAAPPAPKYAAKTYPYSAYEPLGSLTPRDQGGKYELQLRFSQLGAGVARLELANHFLTIQKTDHDVLQDFVPGGAAAHLGLVAFAADSLFIGDSPQPVGLYTKLDAPDQTFWRQTAPGSFEAIITDDSGKDVLRITRTYVLDPGVYTFRITQSIENLGPTPLSVRWQQHGPLDLPQSVMRYGGDVRRVRFGYILPARLDPDQTIIADDTAASLISHQNALDKVNPATGRWDPKVLWPSEASTAKELSLAWMGTTSRYFTVVMFGPDAAAPGAPARPTPGKGADKKFSLVSTVDRVAILSSAPSTSSAAPLGSMVLRIASAPITVAPGQSADVSVSAYAGPTSARVIQSPSAVAAFWHGVQNIVIYTFGGPCGFCTFQPVAWTLQNFLGLLHDYVFHDWALSIMFLVVCVRSLLHPVTRWSQTRMTRFSKQLGKMAPKQKAIQEKYKNDPTKMREEQAKLMREEKIDYFGAVGCLPPFLQTPIWIALYAMLFFFFELRHAPAFFGIVQSLSGGKWGFLGDLAEPDNFINFHSLLGTSADGINVPLLSMLMGPIHGLNILPLILGVVFYIQQKYLTPPPTAALTPEQEQQQKIMKIMTVVMFPLFMYNAPAGLALYFMTNSTLGIFESKWIRHNAEAKIKEEEALAAARGPSPTWERRDKVPEKKGFLQRIQDAALERQKQMEAKRKPSKKPPRR